LSVRIYALARDHDIPSKDVVDACIQLGVEVKSHMSAISEDDAARVLQAIKTRGSRPPTVSGSTPAAAPTVAAPIRREDYIPASGVTSKVPDLSKSTAVRPSKAADDEKKPADNALGAKPKARPLPKLGSAPGPVLRPVTPTKAEPVPEAPKAQKPLMTLSPVALGGKLKDRPAGPPSPQPAPPPAAPAAAKPAPKVAPAPPPVGFEPPTKPPPAEKKLDKVDKVDKRPKVKPVAASDEEEDDRARQHRAGAVAGREERQKKRGRRAQERKTSESPDLEAALNEEDEAPPAPARPTRQRRRIGSTPTTTVRPSHIVVQSPVTVRTLSEAAGIKATEILRKLMAMNVIANINAAMDDETAHLIGMELGLELEIRKPLTLEEQVSSEEYEDRPEDLRPRPPVVAFLGHVDHGKTSLLDALRKSNVVASEAGGITQHIGAYQVQHQQKYVTFLDTPGHEAFTAMRARGANVTDIVVLVVAADDGVMPQTEEAMSHAKAAGVPIVVAVNKVDLPNANVQKVRQQLSSQGLLPQDWGGDTEFVETSATTRLGLDKLLETIILTAELNELKANPVKAATGTCLEASLHETRGVLATFLVREGTLHRGDLVLCGQAYGRVKAMFGDRDQPIREAGPAAPVVVSGLDVVPAAGDRFMVMDSLDTARQIAQERRNRQRTESLAQSRHVTLETLMTRMTEAQVKELRLIIRADVRGSIEAITKELAKLEHAEVKVRVLHAAVGGIAESDVILADASDAVIIGFHVVPDERARSLAEENGVEIRRYEIIYQLTDDIRKSLEGMLTPELHEVELGRALVQQVFKLSRVGTVAGCRVLQGVVERSGKVRLIRDGRVIYPEPGSGKEAGIASLKRVKDDAREVREGFECGIKITGYDDVKEGDVIEVYKIQQTQRTL
jgi:translation initiation factor IF-2